MQVLPEGKPASTSCHFHGQASNADYRVTVNSGPNALWRTSCQMEGESAGIVSTILDWVPRHMWNQTTPLAQHSTILSSRPRWSPLPARNLVTFQKHTPTTWIRGLKTHHTWPMEALHLRGEMSCRKCLHLFSAHHIAH